MDYANKLKLLFRVGDLDLPKRRKSYTSSRVEEGEGHRAGRVAMQTRVEPT